MISNDDATYQKIATICQKLSRPNEERRRFWTGYCPPFIHGTETLVYSSERHFLATIEGIERSVSDKPVGIFLMQLYSCITASREAKSLFRNPGKEEALAAERMSLSQVLSLPPLKSPNIWDDPGRLCIVPTSDIQAYIQKRARALTDEVYEKIRTLAQVNRWMVAEVLKYSRELVDAEDARTNYVKYATSFCYTNELEFKPPALSGMISL